MTITLYDEIEATQRPRPKMRNGRYLIVGPDGKEVTYQRMTNAIRVLEDDFSVQQWKRRNVALGVARNRDLIAKVVAAADTPKALNDLCDKAEELAGGTEKRDLGTALHDIIEAINRGEDPEVPDTFADDIAAYRAKLDELGIEIVPSLVEFVVVLDDHKTSGQVDMGAKVPGLGGIVIADLKTGSVGYGGRWMKMAAQIAGYSRGTLYDIATDERRPWPEPVNQDVGLIVHLPPGEGRCDVYQLNLHAGWAGFEAAQAMAATRLTKGIATEMEGEAPESPPANVRLIGSVTPLTKPPATEPKTFDEGAIGDLSKMQAEIESAIEDWARRIESAPAEVTARIVGWAMEATRAGYSFRIHGESGIASARRRGIYGAAVRLAALTVDDDDAREVIATATGLEVQPGHTVGSVLGQLTIEDAAKVRGHLDAVHVGGARQTA